MLPDFPDIKRKWLGMFLRKVREQSRHRSFLTQIKRKMHFEGDRIKATDMTGDTEESNYEHLSGALDINRQDLIDRGPISLMEDLEKMAEDFRNQQSKMIFKRLDEITAKTGNIVKTGGQDINPDLLLQMLETIEMDFREDGQMQPLNLVVDPEQYGRLIEKIPEWEKDECYKRQYDELIKRKRQEWHDRESHRKLVD